MAKGTAGGAAKILNTPCVSEEASKREKSTAIGKTPSATIEESTEDQSATTKEAVALKNILHMHQVAAGGAADFSPTIKISTSPSKSNLEILDRTQYLQVL